MERVDLGLGMGISTVTPEMPVHAGPVQLGVALETGRGWG